MNLNFSRVLITFLFISMTTGLVLAQEVLWGNNPGEGDFDGGLNGWTLNAVQFDSLWAYSPTGIVDGGFLTGQGVTINSPTASNGAMVFNADLYSTEGTTIPDPPFAEYISELISPTIDLSGIAPGAAMSLQFNQIIYFFQAAPDNFFSSFAVSTDDGVTWSENFDCNSGLPPSTAQNPSPPTNNQITLPIPVALGAAGSATVKVKFTFAGNFYYWALDDIKLTRRKSNDTEVSEEWYAIAPSVNIPLSQVEPMGFLADIRNLGGSTATGVNLNIEVVDGSGATVFTEDLPYGDLIPDSLAENESFGSFTPASLGTHKGTYTLTTDSVDINPGDNAITFTWEVTDTVFAKETGATTAGGPIDESWDEDEPHSWAYGNHFYCPNGGGHIASTAAIAVANGNELMGEFLTLYLYGWADTNDDGNADPDERTRLGYAIYQIQLSDNMNIIRTIPLFNILDDSPGIPLDDGGNYILMVEFTDVGQGDLSLGLSDAYDYGAAILNARQQGAPRYAGMLGINEPLDTEPYSSLGFGWDLVPVVRLHVTEKVFVDTKNLLSEDNIVELFPNPVTKELKVNVSLIKNYADAAIKVIDSRGVVVTERSYPELQNEQFSIPVNDWANGTYFLHVATPDGIRTKHFVVQH